MKIRFLLALLGLAISFAVPTIAQQTSAPDPQLRDALAALNKKMDDGFINGDAAALAALYAEDAVIVSHEAGPIYGRDAIEKHFVDIFKNLHFSKHMSKQEQYSPHVIGTAGNEFWSTGEFDQTFQVVNGSPLRINGHFLNILVREGDAFKIKVDTYNFTGPPVPATETK
jgi:ketosteroid isomerase-like protein